ncbi:hypothetical protein L1987_18633 [Smallanthus sonchifolius]|uniref:Uncharacterized protein n=1 Tax=Smallanthus sonchifolius TaxID=185202 RepID=A0ACB9J1T6_9ASTR|nr:hypothetical protein L1987_18633 [Smallanthus sonchifolius]
MEPMTVLEDDLAFHCLIGVFLVFLTLSASDFATDVSGLLTVDPAADSFVEVSAFFATVGFALDFALSAVGTLATDVFPLSAADFAAKDFSLSAADLVMKAGAITAGRTARTATLFRTASDGTALVSSWSEWVDSDSDEVVQSSLRGKRLQVKLYQKAHKALLQ